MTEIEKLSTAQQREIQEQTRRAMALADEHFECRSVGHSWLQVRPFVDAPFGIAECFYCQRCTMFRVDLVSKKYGELLARRYIAPDNYYVSPPDDGTRSFSASAFRLARARRSEDRELPAIHPEQGGWEDD